MANKADDFFLRRDLGPITRGELNKIFQKFFEEFNIDPDQPGIEADEISAVTLGGDIKFNDPAKFTLPTVYSTGIALTAKAGGGADVGNPLTGEFNQVTTVATEDDSKTLSGAKLGLRIAVINQGANKMQIFPNTGDEINSLGVDQPFDLLPGEKVVFLGEGVDNWESIVNDVIDLTKVRIGMVEFTTIAKAVTAVASGQAIIVPRGTFAEGDLFLNATVNDFDMHFESGAIVDAPASTKAIFDTSNLSGYTGKITGDGVFKKATDASFKGIVFADNDSDNFYIEGIDFIANGNTTFWVQDTSGTAEVKVNVKRLASSNGGSVFYSASGKLIFEAFEALELSELKVAWSDGANAILRGDILTGRGFIQIDSGLLELDFGFLTDSGVQIFGGSAFMQGRQLENVTSVALGGTIQNTGGTLHYDVYETLSDITGATSPVIDHTGGKTFVNGRLKNVRNNASSHGVKVSTSGLIMEDVIVVVTGAADSINSVAAQNVKIYKMVANTAKDANITNIVTGALDFNDSDVE